MLSSLLSDHAIFFSPSSQIAVPNPRPPSLSQDPFSHAGVWHSAMVCRMDIPSLKNIQDFSSPGNLAFFPSDSEVFLFSPPALSLGFYRASFKPLPPFYPSHHVAPLAWPLLQFSGNSFSNARQGNAFLEVHSFSRKNFPVPRGFPLEIQNFRQFPRHPSPQSRFPKSPPFPASFPFHDHVLRMGTPTSPFLGPKNSGFFFKAHPLSLPAGSTPHPPSN